MSDTLRTLTFGDVEQDVWGAAWLPGCDGLLVLGVGDDASVFEVHLELSDQEWRLEGPGLELVAAPAAPAVELSDEEGAPAGSEQLCTVALMRGPDPEIQSAGRRGQRPVEGPRHKLDCIREVSAWFEGGEAVAVFAARGQKQRGQDQDAITAVVLDPEGAPAISDPRLSTTYAASGRPTRMTVELWSADPEEPPRRFAGESANRSAEADGAGWSLRAELMRCHSRGRDGTGVYAIARPA